ncbi:MAG: L,D-transpeptidase family protein [Rhizobiaceae bacterium]|nr:L,D-transpeptidase family protein [Rhizobiaceae bacterium]
MIQGATPKNIGLSLRHSTNPDIQLAHHTEEEWQEFLRQRRAKRNRLKRQRRERRLRRKASRSKRFDAKTTKRRQSRRRLARAKTNRQTAVKKRTGLYNRQEVSYRSGEKPGTVIVETSTRHLYYVLNNKRALRYGVAVGKQGFSWSGKSTIKRKVEWPTWYPPKSMIKRKPSLKKWEGGQPGGPKNPLGAAALYLFQGDKDTLYRIHGTNAPSSIGTAASSGCIRMRNEDIKHLYSKVHNGTKVIVR